MSAIRIFSGFGSSGQNRRPEKVPMKPSRPSIMASETRPTRVAQFPRARVLAAGKPRLDFRPRRGRATERSGVVRALETKFLLFWAGQERDSVPSRSLPFAGTTELVRFAKPTGSTAQPARQDWRGLRRRFPDRKSVV